MALPTLHYKDDSMSETDSRTLPQRLRERAGQYDECDWHEAIELEAAAEIERLNRKAEALFHERNHARAMVDNAVKLLTGIHLLLYPAPFTKPDGRTMVFRPRDPDPHAVLQELSDRIRALPDELEKLKAGQPRTACEHENYKSIETDGSGNVFECVECGLLKRDISVGQDTVLQTVNSMIDRKADTLKTTVHHDGKSFKVEIRILEVECKP